jgi:hypothetical protein
MTDTEQAAYDAAEKKIEELQKEVAYYKQLADSWFNVATNLISIEKLQEDRHTDLLSRI